MPPVKKAIKAIDNNIRINFIFFSSQITILTFFYNNYHLLFCLTIRDYSKLHPLIQYTNPNAKLDPEVFALGADQLNTPYKQYVMFGDSQVGLEAAKSIGMLAIRFGQELDLLQVDIIFSTLKKFPFGVYF
ncbi:hypothetical protein ACA29_06120 [Lederbergia galactosidilytica]|uniref:Uncharacterized protein n=1 Tax=Lederbergia galactosidilytica TaxID=217031 RepID=A0A0Q9YEB3_9BACI|nr:hypothetical protein ACA29_06120 [Lederbergia galactosidilytica]